MTLKSLQSQIDALKKRIEALEQRPTIIYPIYPQPYIPNPLACPVCGKTYPHNCVTC